MKKLFPPLFIFLIVFIFFSQFFIKGLFPIPADDIIGLYNPFRDFYAKGYPRGIPFKNYLITDPVREQYPWKNLVITAEKKLSLPLWNPYNGAGTPLLANFQSAAFYPLNILFFIIPFNFAWGLLVFSQPLLAGLFAYLYLDNLRLSKYASILGAITFSFGGFSVSWLEWGNIVSTGLWTPLILLCIDRSLNKKISIWNILFIISLSFSFFAGYLQTFVYVLMVSFAYFIFRYFEYKKNKEFLLIFSLSFFVFLFLVSFQLFPTAQFINLSARNIDLNWKVDGWFIPWEHLIQFVSPDFFGNPSTLNYFGVWNYGELTGYVGIVPLIFSIFALFFKRDKNVLFFGSIFFISLIFALPTFLAKIPFQLSIPFLQTAQPTRLLFMIDFSLAILAAFGLDKFLKNRRGIVYPIGFISLIFLSLWIFAQYGQSYLSTQSLSIAKHNLFFPTGIFLSVISIILLYIFLEKKNNLLKQVLISTIILVTVFDLLRFGLKFNPFVVESYIFPQTESITFLQKNIGDFRIMSVDPRILPPNFSAFYKIQSLDIYDPLYLLRYGEFIASLERGSSNIKSPFGFNRIINPKNYSSDFINLLGVKYVLSLSELDSKNLAEVFKEGETRIYENKDVFPRTFFVEKTLSFSEKQKVIDAVFDNKKSLNKIAIIEKGESKKYSVGNSKIMNYEENRVQIETENKGEGFLVLTDTFYPTWNAKIDGQEAIIFTTDYHFRGIVVPAGKHKIEFSDNLF